MILTPILRRIVFNSSLQTFIQHYCAMSKDERQENASPPDSSSNVEVSYAGLIRPVLANIIGRIGKLRFLPKTVAKSADRISVALDLREHYYASKEYSHYSRIRTAYSVILPSFLRASLFGTAVFSVYETMQNSSDTKSFSSISGMLSLSPVGFSFCSGLISGTAGALTYFLYDRAWHWTRLTHIHSPAHVEIKFLKYAGAHALMFGSYEYIRRELEGSALHGSILHGVRSVYRLWSRPGDRSGDLEEDEDEDGRKYNLLRQQEVVARAVCVAIAGGISGVIYEGCWWELEPVTTMHVDPHHYKRAYHHHLLWLLRRYFSPHRVWKATKSGLGIALPSSLAFLAYEFGRD